MLFHHLACDSERQISLCLEHNIDIYLRSGNLQEK